MDQVRLDRLISLSKANAYNAYERFNWPASLDEQRPFCSDELLTTYGTEVHDRLSKAQRNALSKWEAVNFFSLNVYGIKAVLEFVSRCMYAERYKGITEYLHLFMAEENAHMWFFATFCNKYAGIIYPTPTPPVGNASTGLERDFYVFVSTLVFEEFVDFYNHKVGTSAEVADLVREINYQHHVDESRHVSFGRELVKDLFTELVASDATGAARRAIEENIRKIFLHFVGLMYNPRVYADAGVVKAAGFPSSLAMRNWLRDAPARKQTHDLWFRRTADFFRRNAMISDMSFLSG